LNRSNIWWNKLAEAEEEEPNFTGKRKSGSVTEQQEGGGEEKEAWSGTEGKKSLKGERKVKVPDPIQYNESLYFSEGTW
jgi:hypothetical protein